MTNQTTAELIAEARDIWEIDDLYPDEMIPRLVKALEAAVWQRDNWKMSAEEVERAEKRWKDRAIEAERELQVAEDQANNLAGDLAQTERERDSAMASYKDYMTLLRKAAELSAVVEKARAVIECESGWFRYRAGRVLDILATDPADALREHDARVWDEGFEAGWAEKEDPGAFVNDVWDAKTPNPYREEER